MLKRIYHYIRYDIPRGIKNLVIWFPAVWQDRQWDHQFIYMILRHKLHLQEQYIREHGIHENNIEDADEIKVCIDILDRLIENDYHSEAFEAHDKRWGKAEIEWEELVDDPDMAVLNITHPNVKTERDHELERIDFGRACEKEEFLHQSDLNLLFELMKHDIRGWWD